MLSDFPYFNSQQLNLDWILERIASMEKSFVPYVRLDAIGADNDNAVVAAFNANVDNMPLGFSILYFGVPNEDEVQVFSFCFRTDTDSGWCFIFHNSDNISISQLNMENGIWA